MPCVASCVGHAHAHKWAQVHWPKCAHKRPPLGRNGKFRSAVFEVNGVNALCTRYDCAFDNFIALRSPFDTISGNVPCRGFAPSVFRIRLHINRTASFAFTLARSGVQSKRERARRQPLASGDELSATGGWCVLAAAKSLRINTVYRQRSEKPVGK